MARQMAFRNMRQNNKSNKQVNELFVYSSHAHTGRREWWMAVAEREEKTSQVHNFQLNDVRVAATLFADFVNRELTFIFVFLCTQRGRRRCKLIYFGFILSKMS